MHSAILQSQVDHIVSDWSNKELRKELEVYILSSSWDLSGVAAVYWHWSNLLIYWHWSNLHQKTNGEIIYIVFPGSVCNLQFAICRVSLQHGRRCSRLALPPLLQVQLLFWLNIINNSNNNNSLIRHNNQSKQSPPQPRPAGKLENSGRCWFVSAHHTFKTFLHCGHFKMSPQNL